MNDTLTAVQHTEPEGFISLFVEQGSAISNLLARLLQRKLLEPSQATYVKCMLAMFPIKQSIQEERIVADIDDDLKLIDALTARQREVLDHIAAGDSNRVIADKLVITVSAVKKHTRNIFAKLNVNSRTQAVARARQLNLTDLN